MSQDPPTKEISFKYDVFGNRIEKRVIVNADAASTFTRRFTYDRSHILNEYGTTSGSINPNNHLATYTYSSLAADDILSVEVTDDGVDAGLAKNKDSYFYLKDHQGSIKTIADSSGNTIQGYEYTAFGTVKKIYLPSAPGVDISDDPYVSTRFSYTGREFDQDSELFYYRARYYDPNIGRFLQRDPDPGSLTSPITFINKYVYTGSNPVNANDPSGEFFFLIPIFAGFAGGLAGGFAASAIITTLGLSGVAAVGAGIVAGAIAGAIAGALVGGLMGGLIYAIDGKNFWDGFVKGGRMGMWAGLGAGAVAGGFVGISHYNSIEDSLADLLNTPGEELIDTAPRLARNEASSGLAYPGSSIRSQFTTSRTADFLYANKNTICYFAGVAAGASCGGITVGAVPYNWIAASTCFTGASGACFYGMNAFVK